jgi:fluoride exporter
MARSLTVAEPSGLTPDQRRATRRRAQWDVLAMISAGGALGAVARSALATAFPAAPGSFPWTTFVINTTGCLLIGVLMTLVTEVWVTQRLIRPFLGVGVLGGFTTFSTYVVDIQRLVGLRAAGTALGYLAGTVIAALAATYAGMAAARLGVRTAHRAKTRRTETRRRRTR